MAGAPGCLHYHADIDGHYYSVLHRLIRGQLDARITARTIELFRKGEHGAVHLRGVGRGRHTTIAEHMPSSHRRFAEWTIERIGREAAAIGPGTAELGAVIRATLYVSVAIEITALLWPGPVARGPVARGPVALGPVARAVLLLAVLLLAVLLLPVLLLPVLLLPVLLLLVLLLPVLLLPGLECLELAQNKSQ